MAKELKISPVEVNLMPTLEITQFIEMLNEDVEREQQELDRLKNKK